MDANSSSNGEQPKIVETTESGSQLNSPSSRLLVRDDPFRAFTPSRLLAFDETEEPSNTAQDTFLGTSRSVSSITAPKKLSNVSGIAIDQSIPSSHFTVVVPASKFKPLPYSTSKTGLVYDARMRYHYSIQDPDEPEPHPERPQRILEIFQELIDSGLVENPDVPASRSDFQLVRIQIRQATMSEIMLVHSERHIIDVQNLQNLSLKEIQERTIAANSVYFHNLTWLPASLAAGGAIEAARAVVTGQVRNAVAAIRPPGHHAEHDEAGGFCFFNNVPIAAKVVQQDFPELCRKILILDWDVHHGNGIQRCFEDDPNVLYISLHVHSNGSFYPLGDFGDHLHCGIDAGLGRNVNIPWAAAMRSDADYILAFQQIVMPIAAEFDPDLVFISAGFDAAAGDPLGNCYVSPAGFAHMTHMLKQLAKGKIVACLEGGYNLQATSKSAVAMTRTLMGEPPERLGELTPSPSAVATIQLVIRTQAKFWKCLYPKALNISRKKELESLQLHDVIREWQSKVLWDNYSMTSLFILRQRISKSFENQVLSTPNYHEYRPLLVIFHDPPETLGFPDPRTGQLELHNTWLTDVSKTYIDWAVKHGFAVIDVNIPRLNSGREDSADGYIEADQDETRASMARELAFYLWDNYIQLSECSHIFLFGVGDAYAGITELLNKHESALNYVDLTICFVADNTLRPVQDADNNSVAQQYHNHSLIFLHPKHPALEKKLRIRYGKISVSTKTNLQEMLQTHWEEVTNRLLEETADWRLQHHEHKDKLQEENGDKSGNRMELDSHNRID